MEWSYCHSTRILRDYLSLWLTIAMLAVTGVAPLCTAQDLQPRRWSHLPIDTNFGGGGYAYTEGNVVFDPVTLIDDASFELQSWPLKYIRTFELAGKSARIDFLQTYQDVEWNGLLDQIPTSISRSGWADTQLRFAVNLIGAPPLSGTEYAEYRAAAKAETIVGLGLELQLPTGEYFNDKLINLGTNRVTFRPQLGITHTRGQWSSELHLATWIFTENDDFLNGNRLNQDPVYAIEGFIDYTFKPGLWMGGGAAYGVGGESTINGVPKNDPRDSILFGVSCGFPVSKQVGGQVSYISQRTQTEVGVDSDSVLATLSFRW
jgi:hypothetical protein